jgi:hypothetical protein
VRYIPDNTGRFPERPFYEIDELNGLCEAIVSNFLTDHYGEVKYPITTDDLTILIEQHVSDLDQWADLSGKGDDVEGVTEFLVNNKPRVLISKVMQSESRENRLRTTFTHELGHVILHDKLWMRYQPTLFEQDAAMPEPLPHCKRDTIIGATQVDWLEWQAGFASGAFLMPITPLLAIVRTIYNKSDSITTPTVHSSTGQHLIRWVQEQFQVSYDAARVRLLQLDHLTESSSPSLLR